MYYEFYQEHNFYLLFHLVKTYVSIVRFEPVDDKQLLKSEIVLICEEKKHNQSEPDQSDTQTELIRCFRWDFR
jgi:hypothetical protein